MAYGSGLQPTITTCFLPDRAAFTLLAHAALSEEHNYKPAS